MNIESIWNDIEKWYDPRKRERQKLFYEVFTELINDIHNGKEVEPKKTRYWEYLKGYHESWQQEPLTRRAYKQLKAKFMSGVKLYHDIKENGIKNPLGLGKIRGKTFLHIGNRRLVIAHILGIKDVGVV